MNTYINELHRLQVVVDQGNEIDEINEQDNTWFSEYVLSLPPGYDQCGAPPLTGRFRSCRFTFDETYEGDDEDLIDAIADLERAVNFPAGFKTRIEDGGESAAASYIRGAVSPERWEKLEAWFFTSTTNISEAVAQVVIRHEGRINSCRAQ